MIQRDIIHNILKQHTGVYITDLTIIKECHESGPDNVRNITMPPIRRCLQELRDAGKIDWIPGEYDKTARIWVREGLWRARI
jgi:hypothetical protein